MSGNRVDLLNPQFTRVMRGYSPKEVDGFLQEIADVLSSHGEEKLRLNSRLAELELRMQEGSAREETLKQTLVATQKMMEEIKSSSQREAQLVLESARNKAESILDQAGMRFNRVLADIFAANKLKMQFYGQLRATLEGHLKLLDMEQQEQEDILKAARELKNSPGA